jgi:hypothetical protein
MFLATKMQRGAVLRRIQVIPTVLGSDTTLDSGTSDKTASGYRCRGLTPAACVIGSGQSSVPGFQHRKQGLRTVCHRQSFCCHLLPILSVISRQVVVAIAPATRKVNAIKGLARIGQLAQALLNRSCFKPRVCSATVQPTYLPKAFHEDCHHQPEPQNNHRTRRHVPQILGL